MREFACEIEVTDPGEDKLLGVFIDFDPRHTWPRLHATRVMPAGTDPGHETRASGTSRAWRICKTTERQRPADEFPVAPPSDWQREVAMTMEVLFAGVRVRNLAAAIDWYGRLFDRPADVVPNQQEAMWRVADGGWLCVVEDAEPAGKCLVTIAVDDLDVLGGGAGQPRSRSGSYRGSGYRRA